MPLLLLVLLGFSVGLLLGTLNVFFRDIGQWVTIVLQIVMWTVPIVYVPGILPGALCNFLPWHPIGPPLMAIHELFLRLLMPEAKLWIGMMALPAGMLLIAIAAFGALRSEIRGFGVSASLQHSFQRVAKASGRSGARRIPED